MNEEEKNEELSEVLDFTKPSFSFVPRGSHEWRQQGPYLICKGCDIEHATWVGMSKQMVGVSENGEPILKNV